MDAEIRSMLSLIDEAFEKKAWHGPNLRGSLRGVTSGQAAWRSTEDRHNIWEIVLHAAYWKYIVSRRLRGEKRGSFPLKGSNWFKRPISATETAWREDIALLEDQHRKMRDAIAALRPKEIHRTPPGSKISNLRMIYGIASHDVYHTAQIQLLKRLMR
jgi:hypothetical protein